MLDSATLLALLPGPAQALAFATAVLVLNATPGVDFLLTVSRTLQGGTRAGVAAALGINAGCVLHALAAAFGLAAVLALVPQAFRAIQWAGAAYLAWLGVGLLRNAWKDRDGEVNVSAVPATPAAPRTAWADFRTGLLTNALNPKVAFFFLAFLPPFVPAASPSKTLTLLLLGGWFIVQSLLFMLVLVALTARLGRMAGGRVSPALRRVLGTLGGALFIALALRLLGARPATA